MGIDSLGRTARFRMTNRKRDLCLLVAEGLGLGASLWMGFELCAAGNLFGLFDGGGTKHRTSSRIYSLRRASYQKRKTCQEDEHEEKPSHYSSVCPTRLSEQV